MNVHEAVAILDEETSSAESREAVSLLRAYFGAVYSTDTRQREAQDVLNEVALEVARAVKKHPPMNSAHEGYAVILEELDELWVEVKADRGRTPAARTEAIQVAAMGVRYAADLSRLT